MTFKKQVLKKEVGLSQQRVIFTAAFLILAKKRHGKGAGFSTDQWDL